MSTATPNCIACSKNKAEFEVKGSHYCQDCYFNLPSEPIQTKKAASQTSKQEESKSQTEGGAAKKALGQKSCYHCKKALDSSQVSDIEGLCLDCAEKAKKGIDLSQKVEEVAFADQVCFKCKRNLKDLPTIQSNENKNYYCMDCYFEESNKTSDKYEGALNDPDHFTYIIFTLAKDEEGERESPENYFSGYLQLNKKDLNKIKAYYIYSTVQRLPATIPEYFSSVVPLSRYQFIITGGCIAQDFIPTSVCLGLVFNKTENYFSLGKLDPMLYPRYAHCSVIIGQELYVLGGLQRNAKNKTYHWLNHCEKLEIQGLKDSLDILIGGEDCSFYWHQKKPWQPIADMNKPRANFCAFESKGKIYAFGGFSGFKLVEETIERYDPAQNKWEILDFAAKLSQVNYKFLAASLLLRADDQIYVIGGSDGTKESSQVLKIDAKSLDLENLKPLNKPRAQAQGYVTSKALYIFGGESSGSTVETYSIKNSGLPNQISPIQDEIDQDSGILGKGFIGNTGFLVA